MTTVDEAIAVLNRIHAADPTVLPALIAYRVPCNRAVADDPTVQVGTSGGRTSKLDDPTFEVGLLGVINGIFGVDEQSWGAEHDDQGKLTRFARTPPRT